MFWIIPDWITQSFKLMVEGGFYMFGLGETTTGSAAMKSLFTGPLSVWFAYKSLTMIPAMKKIFAFYDAAFTILIVPLMIVAGNLGFEPGFKVDVMMKDLKGCTTGDHAYFQNEAVAG
jgi:hypothetical protein